MPPRAQPPKLRLRSARYKKDGSLWKRAVWIIVDGRKTEISTGCGLEDRAGAEQALAAYLSDKHDPSREKDQNLREVLIADVISIYMRDKVPEQARPDKCAQRLAQILEWWGDKTLADINGRTCRDYWSYRCSMQWKSAKPDKTGNAPRMVSLAGARRELEDLRAAIGYHNAEGLHRESVKVTLPPKSPPRTRYLMRDELALLLWKAWRTREQMKIMKGRHKGEPVVSGKRPWRHIARFLLVGAYTGTRAAAICGAAFAPTPGHGWVDLRTGLYYRAEEGAVETNKRQPTILVPRRLLMHLRRWKRCNPMQKFVVEFNGKPVAEVNNGFSKLVAAAGLGKDVVPHTLRHTCATWLSQRGASLGDAAMFLGMSQAIYEKTYRKYSPTLKIAGFQAVPIWLALIRNTIRQKLRSIGISRTSHN